MASLLVWIKAVTRYAESEAVALPPAISPGASGKLSAEVNTRLILLKPPAYSIFCTSRTRTHEPPRHTARLVRASVGRIAGLGLLRPPAGPVRPPLDVFEALSKSRHCLRISHIVQALHPEDTEYLRDTGQLHSCKLFAASAAGLR